MVRRDYMQLNIAFKQGVDLAAGLSPIILLYNVHVHTRINHWILNQSLKGMVHWFSLLIRLVWFASDSIFCFGRWSFRRSVRYGRGEILYLLVLLWIFFNGSFSVLVLVSTLFLANQLENFWLFIAFRANARQRFFLLVWRVSNPKLIRASE